MPWQPGQSGNPSGRPKANPYEALMLEEYAKEAVEVLVKGMRSANESIALASAKDVLDRRHGKAMQGVVVAGDPDNPLIHRIEEVIVDPADRGSEGVQAAP